MDFKVGETLEGIARQPGFHGVRTVLALCEEERRRGYLGDLPHLFYVQKIVHRDRLILMAGDFIVNMRPVRTYTLGSHVTAHRYLPHAHLMYTTKPRL